MNFDSRTTGVGSRHKVEFPSGEFWLYSYKVNLSKDESRNALMARVVLHHVEHGRLESENIFIYNVPSDTKDSIFWSLAEALKMSSKPWKVRKLWWSPKNRELRRELKRYGWHDQGR